MLNVNASEFQPMEVSAETYSSLENLQESNQSLVKVSNLEDSTQDLDKITNGKTISSLLLDLQTYANSYAGFARLQRLMYVADVCPARRVEALTMAISYIKDTYNVTLYQVLYKKLTDSLVESCTTAPLLNDVDNADINSKNLPIFDRTWMEAKNAESSLVLNNLKSSLDNNKKQKFKRLNMEKIAAHYISCGDLNNAQKFYTQTKNYCTTIQHDVNMFINQSKISIYLQNWLDVLSHSSKAENALAKQGNNASQVDKTFIKCAIGVAQMQVGNYKQAAIKFLTANFNYCDFPELISSKNVAMYGGICSIATFNREELEKNVIILSSFQLQPNLHKIIFEFYDSKYISCFELLADIREDLMLDCYIGSHIDILFEKVKKNAIIDYVTPYCSADISKMAKVFNCALLAMESELIQLILDGQINAHNKVLYVNGSSTYFRRLLEQRRHVDDRYNQRSNRRRTDNHHNGRHRRFN